MFIIHSIILLDISPLLLIFPLPWEMGRYSRVAVEVRDSFMESLCCFIANQEGLALIRNTRGDERLLFYCCCYFSCWILSWCHWILVVSKLFSVEQKMLCHLSWKMPRIMDQNMTYLAFNKLSPTRSLFVLMQSMPLMKTRGFAQA